MASMPIGKHFANMVKQNGPKLGRKGAADCTIPPRVEARLEGNDS